MGKYIKREIENKVIEALRAKYAVAIIGARQTGKTTLMNRLKYKSGYIGVRRERIFQFNFDDVLLRTKVAKDFNYLPKEIERYLGEEISQLTEPILVCVDEAQKAPDVFDSLKLLIDQQKQKIRILLTGSSSLDLKKKSAESLAGRIQYFYLFPLSVSELLQEKFSPDTEVSLFKQFKQEKISYSVLKKQQAQIYSDSSRQRALELLLERVLIDGGLPAVWQRPGQKGFVYKSMVETYLEKDIRSLGEVGEMADFTQLLRTTAEEVGGLVNLSELSQAAGVAVNTLKKYYSIMEESFVLNKLAPLVVPRKRFVKSKKLYLFDVGIANYLAQRENIRHLKNSGTAGFLFENVLLKSYESFNKNLLRPLRVAFWRDYQGREVDFVLQKGRKTIPVEATLASELSKRKRTNLNHFFTNFPQADYGLIIYTGKLKKIKISEKPVYLVPWWLWW